MATITEILARFKITQTWDEHIENAGPKLGGVDWATPKGTALPAPAGTVSVEWITPSTPVAKRPAWYNTGLGNAIAWVRKNGTRTVAGHGLKYEGGLFYTGNSGTVRPAPTAARPDAGSHVHMHDVLADGKTRAKPFSTITGTAGGGGEIIIEKGDLDMRLARDVQTGAIWFYTSNGRSQVQTPAHVSLLQRLINSGGNYDNFYGTELTTILFYIQTASTADDAEFKAVLDAMKKIPILDTAAITKVIEAALADAEVEVDYDKIAAQVEATLKDDFAAVNKNIDEQSYTITPKP